MVDKIVGKDGRTRLPPGMSHETPRHMPRTGRVRSIKDASEEFITALAKEWYAANRLDILMSWAQGPSNQCDVVLRTILGESRLSSQWKDQRFGTILCKIMEADIRG